MPSRGARAAIFGGGAKEIFAAALAASDPGWNGYSLRVATQITRRCSGWLRVTLRAGDANFVFANAASGVWDGTANTATTLATPRELLRGGVSGGTAAATPAGPDYVSDWLYHPSLICPAGSSLITIMDVTSGNSLDVTGLSAPNFGNYQAATTSYTNPSGAGFSQQGGFVYSVLKIETR